MRTGTAIVLCGLLVVTGCGGEDRRSESETKAILKLMQEGRAAVLKGDGHAACDLLTPHGRTRTLGFQVDYLEEGTPVPSKNPRAPQTCEAMLRAEFRDERLPSVNQSWAPDLRRARFKVAQLTDTEAKVLLQVQEPYGPEVTFQLRKTSAGWRIDDSDAVPSGY